MPDHLFCLCFEGWFFENRDNGVPNGFALSLALCSVRRAVVTWALPTKTGTPIPLAIISVNITRGQSPRYFQTTFRIKRSSETHKPALLTFRIQIQSTSYVDTAYYPPSFPRRRESIENFKKRVFRKQLPKFKSGFPPARE